MNSFILFNENGNVSINISFIEIPNHKYNISLGINIGASKTVYSIFSKINDKYISNVLLMNNSSRIIPSIICYTKDHRLFGDNSISSLKQNLNTSYNNLSRLIGYNKNDNIFKEEIKFMFGEEELENIKFNYYNDKGDLKNINSDFIIADFLSLINEYYFEKDLFLHLILFSHLLRQLCHLKNYFLFDYYYLIFYLLHFHYL